MLFQGDLPLNTPYSKRGYVVRDCSAAILKGKCLARHVISPQVSFFFLSQSFFIDREENHLFVNIVLSFVVVYIAVYFACSRKKEKFPQI